jgi:hypothetical protein
LGKTTLDLTPNKPVTATYDKSNLLPGVDWRLEMQNTRVPRWFVFVHNIGMHHEPAKIMLKNSKNPILSLLGHNLTGEIRLSGDKTDVSVTGKSHICELMHRGGKLRVTGTPGKNVISIGCTTLELSGSAEMEIQNVHMGRPLSWQEEGSIGEATVADNARLTGTNVTMRDVRLNTTDHGSVTLRQVERHGKLQSREGGGRILIELKSDPTSGT